MSIDPFAYPAEYEPADRLFTRPSHNESAARAEQARNLLDSAQNADHRPSFSHDAKQFNYADGVEALRDAMVGQGHAMLAVRDELADIAGSLRTLAAMPTAMQNVADHVSALDDTIGGGLAELTEAVHKHGLGLSDDQCAIVEAIRAHGEVVDSAVFGVADVMDRPRWWQLRRRWTMRRHRKALDFYAGRDAVAESEADVYSYRVELRCPGKSLEPTVSERFLAKPATASDVAREWLPLLCERARIPADPDEVYGQVFLVLQDGTAIGYIDTVFLPGATVISAPPEGF